jgi:nuclear transport factor 2 (NTF2) superfamily protein
MLAEPTYLEKLWNRGVDVGVGVVTSVIVASVGLAFWKVKLWLDLRADESKQRQQHRIQEDIRREKEREAQKELQQRLARELRMFVEQAEASRHVFHLADCWEQYFVSFRQACVTAVGVS